MAEVLGISDEAFKESAGKTFSDLVEDWGNKAMNDLKESLEKKQLKGTQRTLWNSILAQPIAFDGKTLSVSITALPYADFINKGVQGVKDAGLSEEAKKKKSWINVAPQSPFSFKQGKKPPLFSQWAYLANKNPFAVRESVFRSGIKPNHFIDDVVTGEFEKAFADALSGNLGRAIEVDLKLQFNGK